MTRQRSFEHGGDVFRLARMIEVTGYRRTSILDFCNPKSPRFDPSFPRKIKIGPAAVGWYSVDVYRWLEQKIHSAV